MQKNSLTPGREEMTVDFARSEAERNEPAYKAAERELLTKILEKSIQTGATEYLPIFLCGRADETHGIVQTYLESYQRERPSARIERTTGEALTKELIWGTIRGERSHVVRKYRRADLLAVEGVETFRGMQITMEVFYTVFDVLFERNRQILLTSTMLPKEMTRLENRNRVQFEGGLIFDLRNPFTDGTQD